MDKNKEFSLFGWLRTVFIGKPRDIKDKSIFHHLSLIAFFAWVGLGSDGLSSSCYGPSEAFLTLGKHHYLGLIIGLATALTIFIISESYFQIIELFPSGGGGYIVATKLLSPFVGMLSGCALLVDYVLTITLSIASGADAIFSFLPIGFLPFKVYFAAAILLVLLILNLRGIKESVLPLVPIFLIFVFCHGFAIIYAFVSHFMNIPVVVHATTADLQKTTAELGLSGMLLLILRAYSMGAGTYTGIEAVSNGIPMLREPKVKTAKRTMFYMVVSLAAVVLGLMFAYVFYNIDFVAGKTLNATLFDRITYGWGPWGYAFVLITLISEAAILFVASQTGFLDGPRVLSNMAIDRWVPKRFALLSDRLVTQNGILIMGLGSLILMIATNGSVGYLIVLYSINVFITFTLSQLGMVKHWWQEREKERKWFGKLAVNGIGLMLTSSILVSVVIVKFHDGGWITLLITGTLVLIAFLVKRGYDSVDRAVKKLDWIVDEVESKHPVPGIPIIDPKKEFDPHEKTAVILVKDFTGVGIKTLMSVFKSFGSSFKNIVFVQIGLLNAGVFRGSDEFGKVKLKVDCELDRYSNLLSRHGYHTEEFCLTGIDVVEELSKIAPEVLKKYPNAVFFGGQVVFPREKWYSKVLHNYTLFAMQKELYNEGIPLFILPIELK